MHILDLIMYFVTAIVLWFLIAWLSRREFTEELGGLIGLFIELVWTIVYIILFVWIDYNWVDIFNSHINLSIKW